MNISALLRQRFIPIFFTFFIALQITACSSGDGLPGAVIPPDTEDPAPTINISWVAPSERASTPPTPLPLSEIAGYNIYYGIVQGEDPTNKQYIFVEKDGSGGGSHTFIDPPVGTFYIVLTTIDIDGRHSQPSDEVAVEIN